jgi:hypothetical protein
MPESVSLRDPQYAEQQAKFDASPIAEVTGKEIYSLDEPLPNRASTGASIYMAARARMVKKVSQ